MRRGGCSSVLCWPCPTGHEQMPGVTGPGPLGEVQSRRPEREGDLSAVVAPVFSYNSLISGGLPSSWSGNVEMGVPPSQEAAMAATVPPAAPDSGRFSGSPRLWI